MRCIARLPCAGQAPTPGRGRYLYGRKCALLGARVVSGLCLSDDLRRRMLSTFLSLMNLPENPERAASCCVPEIQPSEGVETQLPLVIAKHEHAYERYH